MHWRSLSPNEAPPYDYAYRIPADLKHAVSYTTLKVLEGGNIPSMKSLHIKELQALEKHDSKDREEPELAAQPFLCLRKPVVRKDPRTDAQRRYEKPTLDISLPHVRCLLSLHPSKLITVCCSQSLDSCVQPSPNTSDSRNQPSPVHPQVLGDKQSSKFAVHVSRAGRIESGKIIKMIFL